MTPFNSVDHELKIRIGKALSAFRMLGKTCKARISLATKMQIYSVVVIHVSILLYGGESWTTTKRQEQRFGWI